MIHINEIVAHQFLRNKEIFKKLKKIVYVSLIIQIKQ